MAAVINPGNIVVPLSAIIEQLRSRLTPSEIDALLFALVSRRRSQVAPGDLITAELINQVLADIADLNLRVSQLEATGGGTTPGEVVIFQPAIGASMRINDQIEITGLNFGFGNAGQRVQFDGIPVSGFLPGSSDNLLRVVVPSLPNVGTGRAAVLNVSNGTSSATRAVFVQPPDQPLTGTIDVDARPSEPNPVAPNANADFPFLLSPRGLNRAAEFQLTATLSGQAWGTQILDSARQPVFGNRLTLNPEQPATAYVRIAVPTNTNGQNFSLAMSVAAGPVSGSSPVTSYVVGTAPPPSDETYTLRVGNVVPPSAFQNGTLRLAANNGISIPVNLQSTLSGQFRYDLVLELIPETPGGPLATGWSFGFLQPVTQPPSQPNATTPNIGPTGSMTFAVATSASPSATGRLRLRVRRQGQSLDRTLDINLARI